MRNIDDLRRALEFETTDLAVYLPVDAIRRRARWIQTRRAALVTATAALAVTALAVPTAALSRAPAPRYEIGAPPASCPTLPTVASLGAVVETGVVLDASDGTPRYDVLMRLIGSREFPGFVVAYRDRSTGAVEDWDTTGLRRAPNGGFMGKRAGDPTHQFLSSQLALGPRSVLDLGLYAGKADRITVTSEGRPTDAKTVWNSETGWTFFWVRRTAAPLPLDAVAGPIEYDGPERLTLTAYDAAGRKLDTVTGGFHIGHSVRNPRDHQPAGPAPKPGGSVGPSGPAAPSGPPTLVATPGC